MRLSCRKQYLVPLFLALITMYTAPANAATESCPQTGVKDWTFLVYLNGNNNLWSFGTTNVKQMENVGSNDKVNVLVEWASYTEAKTKRLYIKKSSDPNNVTSPVIQELPRVDMGDYHSLIDFVQWGVQNYPAKHYFIAVWNHGSGWHYANSPLSIKSIKPLDISYDDYSGHFISTQELGVAMAESAKIIGHKVDLYGSDACLMAMAEVADEMADSVSYFSGSEETEPGLGWPYEPLLKRWEALPSASGADVANILTEEYVKAYGGGPNGTDEVTFSAFDLGKMKVLNRSMADFGKMIMAVSGPDKAKILTAASATQSYAYSDYGDLGDFLNLVEKANVSGIRGEGIQEVRDAMGQFIISNADTPSYAKSTGLSVWLPTSMETYNSYSDRYQSMRFQADTAWGDALKYLVSR